MNVLYWSSKWKCDRCASSTWPARWLRSPAALPSLLNGCAGPSAGACSCSYGRL